MRGFVKIDRRLFASEMWKERRKFSRFEAWLDILQRAAYKDTDDLKAGEVALSVRKTATSWGWPKTIVNRFVLKLISKGLLERTDKESVYKIVLDTKRDTKRDTQNADNQDNTKKGGTPNGTKSGTPHLSYNKKDINKKGGVCLSHTPTPREEVRVTDHDWKRFQEWADEKIHWMSGNITREMYTGMRQKVNNSRLLADILIRIYLSGEYETPQQINEQFGKFTA
jgi:hypothetical protein